MGRACSASKMPRRPSRALDRRIRAEPADLLTLALIGSMPAVDGWRVGGARSPRRRHPSRWTWNIAQIAGTGQRRQSGRRGQYPRDSRAAPRPAVSSGSMWPTGSPMPSRLCWSTTTSAGPRRDPVHMDSIDVLDRVGPPAGRSAQRTGGSAWPPGGPAPRRDLVMDALAEFVLVWLRRWCSSRTHE